MNHCSILSALALCLGLSLASPGVYAVTCAANIAAASNPDSAYTDRGDGTVTHNPTGLVWKRCSEGQSWSGTTCTGIAPLSSWTQALTLAKTSFFAAQNDWRLPNLKELRSLVEECRFNPSINDTIFPNAPSSGFWSGSPRANDPYSAAAWGVSFGDGQSYGQVRDVYHGDLAVRLVRGGQSFDSLAASSVPSCTLTATPTSIAAGGTSTLTANCTPAATSYVWTGGTCANNSAASCTVTPAITTIYGVTGVNSSGASTAATAAVNVSEAKSNYRMTVAGGSNGSGTVSQMSCSTQAGTGGTTITICGNGPQVAGGIFFPACVIADGIGQCGMDELPGNKVTLTALPVANSIFSGWSGACTNSVGECLLTMDADKSVTAKFSAQLSPPAITSFTPRVGTVGTNATITVIGTNFPSTLTINIDGQQPGCTRQSVSDNQGVFSCPLSASGIRTFEVKTNTAANGGSLIGSSTFTVNPAVTNTAPVVSNLVGFQSAAGQPLNISFNVSDAESATLKVLRVHYGASQTAAVCYQDLNLSTGATSTTFNGTGTAENGGSCASLIPTSGQATVWFKVEALDVDGLGAVVQQANVVYQAAQVVYTLNVSATGPGVGVVTSTPTGTPAGIICRTNGANNTCASAFAAGTTVRLTATPEQGSTFTGWSGGCSETGSCTVSMTAAQSVTATFNLMATSRPVCTLTATPSSIAKGGTATLRANCTLAATSYVWTGAPCAGTTGATCTVTPTASSTYSVAGVNAAGTGDSVNATVTVNPTATQNLSVAITGSGSGIVTMGPGGSICRTGTCTAAFDSGALVTLTAVPVAGSRFVGWSEACSIGNVAGECYVTMVAAITVTANFSILGACDASPVSTITLNTYAFNNGYQAFDVMCANGRFGGVRLPRWTPSAMRVCSFRETSCSIAAYQCEDAGSYSTSALDAVYAKRTATTSTLVTDAVIRPLAAWVCQ